jgi:integrative and conjugative element protein (TIGR02256 family)
VDLPTCTGIKEGRRVKDVLPAFLDNELVDVRIRAEAFDFIRDEAVRSRDGKETGGILVGVDDGETVEIRCAGGPGPRAIRRADLISRETAFAQEVVDREWKRDGSDWIGEWHTHTVGRPLPSKLDRRTYEGIVTAADLEFQRFFSLILRANDESWEDLDIVLWEIDRQGIRPRSLLVVNVE